MKFLDPRFRLSGVLLLLGPSLLAGGCARIVHGARQRVEVFTDPPGATATSGDQKVRLEPMSDVNATENREVQDVR